MKIWTYLEASTKIKEDLSMQDETFISANGFAGKFNDALTEAEAEIVTLSKDYLLTNAFIPIITGQEDFPLPDNMYANKIRGCMYTNGSLIYPIKQYRNMQKFENQLYTETYGEADPYRYTIMNDNPGQAYFKLRPMSRETAVLPPSASPFTPVILWYLRNCTRVPLTGEFCNPEVLAPSQFDTGTDTITTNMGLPVYGIPGKGKVGAFPGSISLVTGDAVIFKPAFGGSIPSGLIPGVTYYWISETATTGKIASSLANAIAATPIPLVTQGTVFTIMTVAATIPTQNATVLDIPEFTPYLIQHVKVACIDKDVDPRYDSAVAERERLKKLMVDTLTEAVVDEDTFIQPDFTSYLEHS